MTATHTDFRPRFGTLLDIFEQARATHGDRPLFGTKRSGGWSWVSHVEFADAVDRARGGLARLGVAAGDRVALISDNRTEWAIAAYAAYGLGAAVVPMYEAQRDDNWRYILDDSGAVAVFVADGAIAERVAAFRSDLPELANVIVFEGEGGDTSLAALEADGAAHPVAPADVTGADVAGFVYTSGTTGRPKGVVLTHANIASNVSAVTEVFPVEPDDRTLSILPWAHSFGQTVELHLLLATGASTAFAQSPRTVTSDLVEVAPTMLVSVPRIFNGVHDGVTKRMSDAGGLTQLLFRRAMANADRRRELATDGRRSAILDAQHKVFDRLVFSKVRANMGGRLKYAISGGAAISVEVASFIDNLGIQVYEGYGLSETSPIATANWPGSRRIGSVGKPIPGVRIELDERADDEGAGEIVVHGHCVMQGYFNLPEANAEVFTDDGGFRTGDLGRIDDDGFLWIIGRVKEQYKLENGKYVVPTPLEDRIALSPYIASALVVGANRPHNVALVVLDDEAVRAWAEREGVTGDLATIRDDPRLRELIGSEIAERLSEVNRYEQVRGFDILPEDFTVENGMLTPTLKVKRSVVAERYGDTIDGLYA